MGKRASKRASKRVRNEISWNKGELQARQSSHWNSNTAKDTNMHTVYKVIFA